MITKFGISICQAFDIYRTFIYLFLSSEPFLYNRSILINLDAELDEFSENNSCQPPLLKIQI
uniref:Putative ovule protein n=1 Tax=Solanum chacoense TaxID=4108 RepID=A0A0V0H570_SOLCH